MSDHFVRIRELAGWGLDSYEYRPEALLDSRLSIAGTIIAQRPRLNQSNILLAPDTEQTAQLFDACAKRPDLLSEMAGLSWSLGVVDLRQLIAFQRRLAFSPNFAKLSIPEAGDWPSLFALSFGPPKPVEYEMTRIREAATSIKTFLLQSDNPDLHLRFTGETASPLRVHAGGPFFEVACFRDRWFLRDGYHRAYALLEAGVFAVPAVIVHAANLEELGADQPWFFPEEVLFSQAPPRVVDFSNQELVLEYERAPLLRQILIRLEETLTSATPQGKQP